MSKKKKVSKKSDEAVETPTPPQTIDPSSPPGKGKNAGYKKEDDKQKDDKE